MAQQTLSDVFSLVIILLHSDFSKVKQAASCCQNFCPLTSEAYSDENKTREEKATQGFWMASVNLTSNISTWELNQAPDGLQAINCRLRIHVYISSCSFLFTHMVKKLTEI